ncbi:hypothetical protein HBI56_113880 [Parastagonospora nodorum]|uniref:Uncharacterized protein n=1 Tax=Phaeosphaeria nodorum (strain SN15 / ATCC MYA-4574 / FGSC 10173) TaxID=321614 RepID=A0A7U2F8H3_PHANO|nr:hypothetical protein HBH56_194740 [Parastagonospora nodorum]QRD00477.1 hypothetical protein JI435_415220 [Parastagonospora nodorum SN15]KAH3924982.1 hypothetical protein HBH54_188750 [Parastagonospora nodorum]KAH3953118.1 hypothetical protein HBH53_040890 [Parastagonospora nodorum]KAH3976253.1 hypothetical protein HBH52_117600 [Parastagonospora nodorum]
MGGSGNFSLCSWAPRVFSRLCTRAFQLVVSLSQFRSNDIAIVQTDAGPRTKKSTEASPAQIQAFQTVFPEPDGRAKKGGSAALGRAGEICSAG